MFARDRQRGRRRSAEIDRHVRPLCALDERRRTAQPVERAVVVDRRVGLPDPFQHVEVFAGPAIARIVRHKIAVTLQVRIVAARHDVQREPAAAEHVERRDLPRGGRRHDHARPVREQDADAFGRGGRERRNDETVRRVAEVADQDLVEAGGLVRLREAAHVVGLDGRAARYVDLRAGCRGDHADDVDWHVGGSFGLSIGNRGRYGPLTGRQPSSAQAPRTHPHTNGRAASTCRTPPESRRPCAGSRPCSARPSRPSRRPGRRAASRC